MTTKVNCMVVDLQKLVFVRIENSDEREECACLVTVWVLKRERGVVNVVGRKLLLGPSRRSEVHLYFFCTCAFTTTLTIVG